MTNIRGDIEEGDTPIFFAKSFPERDNLSEQRGRTGLLQFPHVHADVANAVLGDSPEDLVKESELAPFNRGIGDAVRTSWKVAEMEDSFGGTFFVVEGSYRKRTLEPPESHVGLSDARIVCQCVGG